jgi:hypothetical protein
VTALKSAYTFFFIDLSRRWQQRGNVALKGGRKDIKNAIEFLLFCEDEFSSLFTINGFRQFENNLKMLSFHKQMALNDRREKNMKISQKANWSNEISIS